MKGENRINMSGNKKAGPLKRTTPLSLSPSPPPYRLKCPLQTYPAGPPSQRPRPPFPSLFKHRRRDHLPPLKAPALVRALVVFRDAGIPKKYTTSSPVCSFFYHPTVTRSRCPASSTIFSSRDWPIANTNTSLSSTRIHRILRKCHRVPYESRAHRIRGTSQKDPGRRGLHTGKDECIFCGQAHEPGHDQEVNSSVRKTAGSPPSTEARETAAAAAVARQETLSQHRANM